MGLASRQDWKSFLRRASTGRSHTATAVEGGGKRETAFGQRISTAGGLHSVEGDALGRAGVRA